MSGGQQSPTTTHHHQQQSTVEAFPHNYSSSSSNGNGNEEIVPCKLEEQEHEHEHKKMTTLEDFLLAKAQTTFHQHHHDSVKIPPPSLSTATTIFNFNSNPQSLNLDDDGKGKRRLSPPSSLVDKAAQQRQKRMIKNRESAARSRERKQAYQTQLESLLLKLQQDNHILSIAKTDNSTKRYKQLMDNIIPVTEKRRPTRCVLRKVRSMEW